MRLNKRTKALSISKETKDAVYSRDNGRCIICGAPGLPEAHYISRAHSGLGVERNIVTLCRCCHRNYDQSINRAAYREEIRRYLQSRYEDWNEDELIYKKEF